MKTCSDTTSTETTRLEDSTTTSATIAISTDISESRSSFVFTNTIASGDNSALSDATNITGATTDAIEISTIPTTSNEQTETAHIVTSAKSSSTELGISSDTTEISATIVSASSGDSRVSTDTIYTDIMVSDTTSNSPTTTIDATPVTSEATTAVDTTTTLIISISEAETTTTTERLWTSTTTAESCPVVSVSIEDPSSEGGNTGEDRWDCMGQFAGIAVPFQQESSTSQDIPRARSGEYLISAGAGSTLGSDMWRPISLDPTKKCQDRFSYAPVPVPDQDWGFSFIISTQRGGHVYNEKVVVPKGAPFKYVHRTAIFQGAVNDRLYAFMRINNQAVVRSVAVDDIYVGEYKPTCAVPTEPTSLCGGTQGFFSTTSKEYTSISMFRGSVEMCARACLEDETFVLFGQHGHYVQD
ncbi:hypothetical protein FBEOM_6287 [Fusarium beomiforme]|uniref:Uncharacterized protein n=1 Tax=Fusarium beomiforme TaxID=44412 RepID=A0A9P5AJF7_9HYPO|nr:hypothetical protein FBEOM_6287 [Fusarium beomiforme]